MKKFIYENKSKDLCYGCRACEQICSHKAITMQTDVEGFLYPIIDTSKCTECGLCEKVCPTQDLNKNKILYPTPTTCYAAWNNNLEERMQSTSGGLFYLLARSIIEDGGVVYGSAMNNNLSVEHIRATTVEALQLLRGSKYVQSNTLWTFSEVKADLKNGLKVLYSGTPCQIAGLRSFLLKDYENLYTIDLVCHGTPSPLIFKEHLNYLSNKYASKVTSFLFRSKKKSGWSPYIAYTFENKKKVTLKPGNDFYAQCFYAGYLSRKSCYLCEYSQSKRTGDITLSDFWGSEPFNKRLKQIRKYGYNMVMCNTEKGTNLIQKIMNQINTIELNTTIAINGDIRLRTATKEPAIRQKIYTDYLTYGYDYIISSYFKRSLSIKRFCPTFIINFIKEITARI